MEPQTKLLLLKNRKTTEPFRSIHKSLVLEILDSFWYCHNNQLRILKNRITDTPSQYNYDIVLSDIPYLYNVYCNSNSGDPIYASRWNKPELKYIPRSYEEHGYIAPKYSNVSVQLVPYCKRITDEYNFILHMTPYVDSHICHIYLQEQRLRLLASIVALTPNVMHHGYHHASILRKKIASYAFRVKILTL